MVAKLGKHFKSIHRPSFCQHGLLVHVHGSVLAKLSQCGGFRLGTLPLQPRMPAGPRAPPSASPVGVSQVFRLLSPTWLQSEPLQLSFFYSMYGSQMGTLEVLGRDNGVWTSLWTRSGDQVGGIGGDGLP